jgi:hypothetical protein
MMISFNLLAAAVTNTLCYRTFTLPLEGMRAFDVYSLVSVWRYMSDHEAETP